MFTMSLVLAQTFHFNWQFPGMTRAWLRPVEMQLKPNQFTATLTYIRLRYSFLRHKNCFRLSNGRLFSCRRSLKTFQTFPLWLIITLRYSIWCSLQEQSCTTKLLCITVSNHLHVNLLLCHLLLRHNKSCYTFIITIHWQSSSTVRLIHTQTWRNLLKTSEQHLGGVKRKYGSSYRVLLAVSWTLNLLLEN